MNSKSILSDFYYTFDPLNKRIIFNNIQLKHESIALITNLNDNTIIYNFACSTTGGILNNNILSLVYNTTLMSSSDKLMIVIIDSKDSKVELLSDISSKLGNIEEVISPLLDIENCIGLKNIIESIKPITPEILSYININSAQTEVLKIGGGMLNKIIINSPGNDTITVVDNYTGSGPIIAVIKPDLGKTPFYLEYNLNFIEGLMITTTGTSDITVVYK